MAEQVTQIIDSICERLGVAAEYLYPLLVRQAYVDGITALLGCLLFPASIVALYFFYKHFFKPDKEGKTRRDVYYMRDDGLFSTIMLVCLATVAIATFFTSLGCIGTAISALANPEWYVITSILNKLK